MPSLALFAVHTVDGSLSQSPTGGRIHFCPNPPRLRATSPSKYDLHGASEGSDCPFAALHAVWPFFVNEKGLPPTPRRRCRPVGPLNPALGAGQIVGSKA